MSEYTKLYQIKITGPVEAINNARMHGVAWRDCDLCDPTTGEVIEDPTITIAGERKKITVFGLQGFPSLWHADGNVREVRPHVEEPDVDEYWADLTGQVLRMVGLFNPAAIVPIIRTISGTLDPKDIESTEFYLGQNAASPLIVAPSRNLVISPLRGPAGFSHNARAVGERPKPQWSFIWKTTSEE